MNIGDAAITAVFGYAVVFAGLLILMTVLYCMGAFFKSRDAKSADEKSKLTAQTEPEPEPVTEKPVAKGSAGRIKLYDVPDKEAAMIMAIVADTMKKPINELHFISIKEVK